jgi:hypothetical protein
MANKPTKPTRKKSSAKVRDLAARKDPKGGAQKKEAPGLGAPKGGGGVLKPVKSRLV